MAQQIFNIDSFPPGYFMSWYVTTQAAFQVHARLFDSTTVYFDATKQSTNFAPPLSLGAAMIQGTQLKLSIDEPQSQALNASITTYNITAANGTIVGLGYNISIEDYIDNDFNDVCVALVAWKSKG